MGLDGTQTGTRFVVGERPDTGGRVAAPWLLLLLPQDSFTWALSTLTWSNGRDYQSARAGQRKPSAVSIPSASVEPAEASAGLRLGDRLRSVAGDADAGFYGPALALSRVPYGASYQVQVERGRASLTISFR